MAWKKRLSDKEKDLHQLVADKANLQLQVKQLEDTIEKVKQAEDVSLSHDHLLTEVFQPESSLCFYPLFLIF